MYQLAELVGFYIQNLYSLQQLLYYFYSQEVLMVIIRHENQLGGAVSYNIDHAGVFGNKFY